MLAAAQPLQQFAERRIPLRLLAYWERLRKDRIMPSEEDVDFEDIHDIWDNCFVIDIKDVDPSQYRYNYVGQGIINAYSNYSHDIASDAPFSPEPGLAGEYMTVVETRKPLIVNGEFTDSQGHIVKYRQCLLPLGEGEEVYAILGALHVRVFQ